MSQRNKKIKYLADRDTLELYNLLKERLRTLAEEMAFIEGLQSLIEKRKGLPYTKKMFRYEPKPNAKHNDTK